MRVATVLAALLLAGCVSIEASEAPMPAPAAPPPAPSVAIGRAVDAPVVNGQGARIGVAHFREGPWGVVIRLEFNARSLTPGWHGLHLHQNGDCTDFAAGFKASGAHVGHGMDGAQHGLLNAAGPEAGDLPNIYAAETGAFGAELFSPNVTLAAQAQDWRMPLLTAKAQQAVKDLRGGKGPGDHFPKVVDSWDDFGASTPLMPSRLAP